MKELEISQRKRQENLNHNLLGELYCFLLEAESEGIETDAKFEAAVKDGSSPNVIIDLAAEWCAIEKESSFKKGFRFAIKLLKEGSSDLFE